jgi:hypothetical protein
MNINSLPIEVKKSFLDREFDKLIEKQKSIRNDWVRLNKCKCVGNIKKGKVLSCPHVEKEINQKIKQKKEKLSFQQLELLNKELIQLKCR